MKKERKLRSNNPVLLDSSEEEQDNTKAPPHFLSPDNRGLPDIVKKKLFEALDAEGGVEALSSSNRVLQDICDKDPESFGSPGKFLTPRNRRKKVSNFVDKYKGLSPQLRAKRRSNVFQQAATAEKVASEVTATVENLSEETDNSNKSPSVQSTRKTMTSRSPYRKKHGDDDDDDGKFWLVLALLLASCFTFLL
jgi:hypothetical protein